MDNNNKALRWTLTLLIFLLLGSFITFNWFSNKLDKQMLTIKSLETKMAALNDFNKTLPTTCATPERAPASVDKPALKKLLRDDIYKIVFSHSKELNACYKMRLNKRSDERRMIVSLVVKNSGEVVDARTLNSDIKNRKVEECVTSLIKNIQFPQFDGDLFKDEVYISFDSRSLI